jgi:signal transduction histidine kinase
LRLDACDLGAVADEVVAELSALHGERIVLKAEEQVRGIWSAEELRRAVWNLATNAVKYGAPNQPITVTVGHADGWAKVAVHNHGRVIAKEEQARLFEPFARAQSLPAGAQAGWGLGLTLVRGCAEAHGGRVEVESDAAAGTTFTLLLPLDSRPYQPQNEPAQSPE